MKFEEVLPALREGKKIRRKSWWKDTYIYINSYGNFETKRGGPFEIILVGLYDLEKDCWEIVKERKKVKLRDLTEEQLNKWKYKNCRNYDYCIGCPFQKVQCENHERVNDAWYLNKDLYSDKFLDQEIEIEEE